jgi:hypothetical protein
MRRRLCRQIRDQAADAPIMFVERVFDGIEIGVNAACWRLRSIVQRRVHDPVQPGDIMLQHDESEPFLGSEMVGERAQRHVCGSGNLAHAGRRIAALVEDAGAGFDQKIALGRGWRL